MKNKYIYILAGVLFLLIALVVFRNYKPEIFPEKPAYLSAVSAFTPKSVNSIEMAQKGKTVVLKKENGLWKADGKNADSKKIESMLEKLLKPAGVETVAITSSRHGEFELAASPAGRLNIDGKLMMFIGKNADNGIYLRLDKSDSVYLLKDLSPFDLSENKEDWYDKTIVAVEEKNISKITITKGKADTVVIRKDNKWFKEDGKTEIEQSKISSILTSLASFQANALVDKETVAKYPKNPEAVMVIDYDSSSKHVVEFYKGSSSKDYLVKRVIDSQYFTVGEYTARDLINLQF